MPRPTGPLTTAAFEAHWSMIHGHAFRLVRNETSADDLAQEAFVRLWEAERQNRWPDVPPAWLATVVSNLAISGFRQSAVARRRAIELTQVGSGAGHDDVRDTEFRADAEAIVIRALDRLSADSRRAVVLAGAGYTRLEIGQEIGRTASAARTLLCRSRRALRLALADAI